MSLGIPPQLLYVRRHERVARKLIVSTKKGAETACVSSALAWYQARTRACVRSLSLNDHQTVAASAASSLIADRSASFVVNMGVVYHVESRSSS